MTQANQNVFEDLGFSAEESENLRVRSDLTDNTFDRFPSATSLLRHFHNLVYRAHLRALRTQAITELLLSNSD